jgi:hypothetical protein
MALVAGDETMSVHGQVMAASRGKINDQWRTASLRQLK